MNYRVRLIVFIVFLLLYLYLQFPLQSFITTVVIAVGYFIIKNIKPLNNKNKKFYRNQTTYTMRTRALEAAQLYLAPYKSIWENLNLSNHYLSVSLNKSGTVISASELNDKKRQLKVYTPGTIFEQLCFIFDSFYTMDSLIEFLERQQVEYYIAGSSNSKEPLKPEPIKDSSENIKLKPINFNPEKHTDINNATEKEIAELPGVSIILAKKIIKRRNEIDGFKSIEDFLTFTKLNNHALEQIKPLIEIKEIKQNKSAQKTEERRVDL